MKETSLHIFSGSNYEAGLAAIRFLTVSGYDFRWQYFPGKGHTWGNNDYDTQLNALGFIWKTWIASPSRSGIRRPDFVRDFRQQNL